MGESGEESRREGGRERKTGMEGEEERKERRKGLRE